MVDVLLASGWDAGRNIATHDWEVSLQSLGWPDPIGMQRSLLESLGGLILRPENNQESQWNQESVKVDPIAAAYVCDREHPENDPSLINWIEDKIGETLYPFAQPLVAAPVCLFTTPAGRLIAAGSGIAYSLGDDFQSSFYNFAKQTTLPRDLCKL
jgi:hypothetical protein